MAGRSAASTIFNFDDLQGDIAAPFSVTVDGLTATFTPVPEEGIDPSGFVGYGSVFPSGVTETGRLVAAGFRNGLDVTFSNEVNSVRLDWLVLSSGGSSFFSLGAADRGRVVGSAEGIYDNIDQFGNDIGHVFFAGVNFDEIFVADGNHEFVIDNLEVTQTPEMPTAQLVLASLMIGTGMTLGRKKLGRVPLFR